MAYTFEIKKNEYKTGYTLLCDAGEQCAAAYMVSNDDEVVAETKKRLIQEFHNEN